MSHARNLARIARNGTITVDNAQEARDLEIYNGIFHKSVVTLGVNEPGDGGGGPWRLLPEAAPGTYVDDTGTILVPTGSDGSVALGRPHAAGYVNFLWFGGIADGNGLDGTEGTDNSPVWARINQYRLAMTSASERPLLIKIPPGAGEYIHRAGCSLSGLQANDKNEARPILIYANGAQLAWDLPSVGNGLELSASPNPNGPPLERPLQIIGGRWRGYGNVYHLLRVEDVTDIRFRHATWRVDNGIAVNLRIVDSLNGFERVVFSDCSFLGSGADVVMEGASATGGAGTDSFARLVMLNNFHTDAPSANPINDDDDRINSAKILCDSASPYEGCIEGARGNVGGFGAFAWLRNASSVGAFGNADFYCRSFGFETAVGGPGSSPNQRDGDRSGTVSVSGSVVTVTSAEPLTGENDGNDKHLILKTHGDQNVRCTFVGGAADGADLHTWITAVNSTSEFVADTMPADGWTGGCYVHGMYALRLGPGAYQADSFVKWGDFKISGGTRWRATGKGRGFTSISLRPSVDLRSPQAFHDNPNQIQGMFLFEKIGAKRIHAEEIQTGLYWEHPHVFEMQGDEVVSIPFTTAPFGDNYFSRAKGLKEITVLSTFPGDSNYQIGGKFLAAKSSNNAGDLYNRTVTVLSEWGGGAASYRRFVLSWDVSGEELRLQIARGSAAETWTVVVSVREYFTPVPSLQERWPVLGVTHRTKDKGFQ